MRKFKSITTAFVDQAWELRFSSSGNVNILRQSDYLTMKFLNTCLHINGPWSSEHKKHAAMRMELT